MAVAAAGMAATFNAPLASILLAAELLLFELKPRSLIPVSGVVLAVTNPEAVTGPATGVPTALSHLLNAVASFQVPRILDALLGEPNLACDGPFTVGKRGQDQCAGLRRRAIATLLIGPWTHLQAGLGQGLPVDGVPVLDHIELQWFGPYLKGMDVGADQLPNVTQSVSDASHPSSVVLPVLPAPALTAAVNGACGFADLCALTDNAHLFGCARTLPSSSGPGRCPLTAKTRVRLSLGVPL